MTLSSQTTLREHGRAAIVEDQPACALCNGWRWVSIEASFGTPEFGKVKPCECQKKAWGEQKQRGLIEYSDIGPLARMTFDSADSQGREGFSDSESFRNAFEKAFTYAMNPIGWLLISGVPGTGKTHLAASIVNHRTEKGYPALFQSLPILLDRIRDGEADVAANAEHAPLLVLDDFGMQRFTPWAEEKVDQILRERYLNHAPTVIVTSVELAHLGDRARSRLHDSTLVDRVHIKRGASIGEREDLSIDAALRASMTFDSFNEKGRGGASELQRETLLEAKEAALIFAKEPKDWLYLCGSTGVGKTHLAVAIANVQIELRLPVVFRFVPELMDDMRRSFGPESGTGFYHMFDNLKDASVMILDDLGAQVSTAWAEEKLYQLIVHRHNRRLPTVITSRHLLGTPNNKSPLFTSRYADAIHSRLCDAHLVVERFMDGPDYRNRGRIDYAHNQRPDPDIDP